MALGRGLDSLIPDFGINENEVKTFMDCDINIIKPNRYQPRRQFSDAELEELSISIKEKGILQPLLVRRNEDGTFELIAGERRLRAAKNIDLISVPVIIKDISDKEMLEISLIENVQRQDLNPIEEADAYHLLMTEFNLTQEDVSGRVGKSRSAIANFLRLRNLSNAAKNSIKEGKISMGHAKALLSLEEEEKQNLILDIIISKDLSVRETELIISRFKSEQKDEKKKEQSDIEIYFSNIADDLSKHIGTKVNIKRYGKKGKLEIEYYNDEDLDRLINRLKQV
ncbi:MAG: ParB/RepB/Spo0J family partition protein [Desulfobacterales bacterium]|nr:ParB/RepB/Spo0J family partition protein [Desulfobacterales bacterium]MBF0397418.1 ParB/RepB/Spo0J family partition protein [Desulfobacterales bacterium]